jgi:hypothetical protein
MDPSVNTNRRSNTPPGLLENTYSDVSSFVDLSTSELVKVPDDDTPSFASCACYEGIDWNRLAGYSISRPRKRPRTGWVWEHGYDIEKDSSRHRYWVCKLCHQRKATATHIYDAASTSQANGHMADAHRIGRDGHMPPRGKRQRTLLDMVTLDAHQPKEQAMMNAFISSFDPGHFQQLLIRWVTCDNIPYHKLESPYFRQLLAYANSAIIDSGSLPTHTTIREWIVRSFSQHKGTILLAPLSVRINRERKRPWQRTTCSRRGLPCAAAFACTDYKVQGRTLERVALELRGTRTTNINGEAVPLACDPCSLYVQLSRCPTFSGIMLLSKVRKRDFIGNTTSDSTKTAKRRLEELSEATLTEFNLWESRLRAMETRYAAQESLWDRRRRRTTW